MSPSAGPGTPGAISGGGFRARPKQTSEAPLGGFRPRPATRGNTDKALGHAPWWVWFLAGVGAVVFGIADGDLGFIVIGALVAGYGGLLLIAGDDGRTRRARG